MWIKFKYEAVTGIGTFGGAHLTKDNVKFAIEADGIDNALAITRIFKNIPKVKDAEININRPTDMNTVYINKEGNTESRSDLLVTNNDLQGFIWSIKAGIAMGKALCNKDVI